MLGRVGRWGDERGLQVIVEIAIVDDRRVELVGMGFENFIGEFGNHARGLAVLRVD